MISGWLTRTPGWGLVFAGGCLGTLTRWGLGVIAPGMLATSIVNLLGAFLLGLLYARTADTQLKLLLGTGFMGAFTTYGGMAVLAYRGGAVGLLWAALLVALGVVAAWLGERAGAYRHQETQA